MGGSCEVKRMAALSFINGFSGILSFGGVFCSLGGVVLACGKCRAEK